jgi:hypothetical protein
VVTLLLLGNCIQGHTDHFPDLESLNWQSSTTEAKKDLKKQNGSDQ